MSRDEIEIMFMSGPDDGRCVALSQRKGHGHISGDGTWLLMFGRRDDCDVIVPFDTQVSRQHATLRIAPDGGIWLDDQGSLNGTFLGKARITSPTPLQPGELFRLGRTWFRVQVNRNGEA